MTDQSDASQSKKGVYDGVIPRAIRFDELKQDSHEVLIEYRGQVYRLIATKNGRLVLNK